MPLTPPLVSLLKEHLNGRTPCNQPPGTLRALLLAGCAKVRRALYYASNAPRRSSVTHHRPASTAAAHYIDAAAHAPAAVRDARDDVLGEQARRSRCRARRALSIAHFPVYTFDLLTHTHMCVYTDVTMTTLPLCALCCAGPDADAGNSARPVPVGR